MNEIERRLHDLKRDCMATDQVSTPDVLNRVIELVDIVQDLAHVVAAEKAKIRF